jgi:hypothetical protein
VLDAENQKENNKVWDSELHWKGKSILTKKYLAAERPHKESLNGFAVFDKDGLFIGMVEAKADIKRC